MKLGNQFFELLVATLLGFNGQQMLGRRFELALPAVDGFLRRDGDASGKPSLDKLRSKRVGSGFVRQGGKNNNWPHVAYRIDLKGGGVKVFAMRYVLLAILLIFPFAELALLAHLFKQHGWWVAAWLLLSAAVGVVLIKQARFAMISRVAAALSQGRFSLTALIDSARTLMAGLLLIFPGILSDCVAIVLLLLPMRDPQPAFQTARPTSRPDARVIDGDFRRE
jgi:UPF0716 protein FxsA